MLPHIRIQSIRANRKANVVYLNNPKSGCTTVKANLWSHIAPDTYPPRTNVHDLKASPFTNKIAQQSWLRDATVVTFVRNPYVRLASAFLDKIGNKDIPVWGAFAERYGLHDPQTVSFDLFVEIIAGEPPEFLDPHWRPQHINIMYPFVRPNFLGRLETIDQDLPYLLSECFGMTSKPPKRQAPHATGAGKQAGALLSDSGTLSRARALYERDFELFGYSSALEDMATSGFGSMHKAGQHDGLDLLRSLRDAEDGRGRQEILSRLADHIGDTDDRFTRNWLLHSRIEADARQGRGDVMLIRGNLNEIVTGYDFLKRTAARIAAASGAWDLVRCISRAASA
ncbi:Sulfotransferase family protein [Cribrihabitans marinus]|uniref:Sulfotransferase family protein n=1 Tax=Cribrihabitans marinus TaxID=1227549 RepID=A0A1H7DXA3_9RHOB|nr:sulfotransferase family protein [Cribrihabitans marinus]GGH41004.1 hypothetical protein GCM10010973_37670 [Cribrihabitans marinus]SEK06383.1 Sulfotransferase family protein [Cribrihabitans marinus]